MAIFTSTLADAFAAIPSNKINHFISLVFLLKVEVCHVQGYMHRHYRVLFCQTRFYVVRS